MITLPPIGLSKLKGRWPVFRSLSFQEDAAGSGTIVRTKPAGVVSGDVLLSFHYARNGDSFFNGGGGWVTLFSATPTMDGVTHQMNCCILVAGGSEPASWSPSYDTSGGNKSVVTLAYTGGHATQTAGANDALLSVNFGTHEMPSLTSTFDYAMMVSCWFFDVTGTGNFGGVSVEAPGMTLRRASADTGFGGESEDAYRVYDERLGVAGATGTRTVTTNNNCTSYGMTVGIRRS